MITHISTLLVMFSTILAMLLTKAATYVREQLAQILKLFNNTVSLSFFFTGLDYDLCLADLKDREKLSMVQDELTKSRAEQ